MSFSLHSEIFLELFKEINEFQVVSIDEAEVDVHLAIISLLNLLFF